MTTRHFRHLPVAGDTGLLGLVDITDVCRALLGAEQGSLRDPRCSKLPTEVTGPTAISRPYEMRSPRVMSRLSRRAREAVSR